jgi:hypothetical protein
LELQKLAVRNAASSELRDVSPMHRGKRNLIYAETKTRVCAVKQSHRAAVSHRNAVRPLSLAATLCEDGCFQKHEPIPLPEKVLFFADLEFSR